MTLSATVGRVWAYGLLALPVLGIAWVHRHWLPKHGINGWTAEPRERYLTLVRALLQNKTQSLANAVGIRCRENAYSIPAIRRLFANQSPFKILYTLKNRGRNVASSICGFVGTGCPGCLPNKIVRAG